jgi:hypothetical protein
MSNPNEPYRYLSSEYDDLCDLKKHLKEIADGYFERQYDDVVWEALTDTINTIQHVLDRMEQGD